VLLQGRYQGDIGVAGACFFLVDIVLQNVTDSLAVDDKSKLNVFRLNPGGGMHVQKPCASIKRPALGAGIGGTDHVKADAELRFRWHWLAPLNLGDHPKFGD